MELQSVITNKYIILLKSNKEKEKYLEADKQYQIWGFNNIVFIGSLITTYGYGIAIIHNFTLVAYELTNYFNQCVFSFII